MLHAKQLSWPSCFLKIAMLGLFLTFFCKRYNFTGTINTLTVQFVEGDLFITACHVYIFARIVQHFPMKLKEALVSFYQIIHKWAISEKM